MRSPFKYFNSSPEVIRFAVMMYVRYPLSLRNVEDLLSERGIDICHETVRLWWNRFDPMFVKINGETHYLWRAMDHEGEMLEAVVTDKLRSYGAAMQLIGNAARQECENRWINNRAENSHQPLRRRERAMLRFRRMKTLQKFAAVHGAVHNHFNQERHLTSRGTDKRNRSAALAEWKSLMA